MHISYFELLNGCVQRNIYKSTANLIGSVNLIVGTLWLRILYVSQWNCLLSEKSEILLHLIPLAKIIVPTLNN